MIKYFGSKIRPQPLSGCGEENEVHVPDEEMNEERIITCKIGFHLPGSDIKLQMSDMMKIFYLNSTY